MNFTEALELVEKKLNNIDLNKQPVGLYKPVKYTLANGGKRIRPALVLMAHAIFSADVENTLSTAIGIEVFHNFTLLHDDIMDDAGIRRGKPSVHKRWNNNTAILSGDAMMILAYQLVADCNPDHLPKVLSEFSRVAMEVCEGQQYDMDFEERENVTIDEYLNMIRLKTAVLLASSLKIGAILGGAPEADAQHLYAFGLNIGLAFQLMDDILDVFAETEEFGKEPGGDIVSNKKTFLLLSAMELARGKNKEELEKWIAATAFDKNEKYLAVKQIYNETGVKDLATNKMNDYYFTAITELEKVSGYAASISHLKALADLLMKRTK